MIPKATPRIPDTPGTFTIEWEDSLQKAGLILTEKLRDYWKDISRRLEQEYSPILTNLKSLINQDQWNTVEDILEQIAREIQQELKKKKPAQQVATTNYQEMKLPYYQKDYTLSQPQGEITQPKCYKIYYHLTGKLDLNTTLGMTQTKRMELHNKQIIKYYTPVQVESPQVDRIHS